jgi:glyoxylase-like metal-dependent hydrolase (beta-lactamase superfamily II)
MRLYQVNTGIFKIANKDMFVNLPVYCCSKPYPTDKNDFCKIAIKSLLVTINERKILIDTGVGNLIDKILLDNYNYVEKQSLSDWLRSINISPEEITDVILTHLHFDHCGGCIIKDKGGKKFTFPNATYWINRENWEWAQNLQERELDSYYDDIFDQKLEIGNWKFVEHEGEVIPGISVRFLNGHTRGLMIPFIDHKGKTIVFTGDLIPTSAHLSYSNLMSYDINPSLARKEKQQFLKEAIDNGYILFLQHDLYTDFCASTFSCLGVRVKRKFTLEEIINIPCRGY